MKSFLVTVTALSILSGCASSEFGRAGAGGAVYEYNHTEADGSSCGIRITSAREVGKGTVRIANDCSISTDVDSLGGVDGAYEVIKSLVTKLPGG